MRKISGLIGAMKMGLDTAETANMSITAKAVGATASINDETSGR